MDNGKYFSRSWALLTRDKGWIKPLLVMAAATLVPVAGPLGNRGFALEWARLSAWGADAAPKQKNVDVGACIASGFRGFVVALGWGAVFGIATGTIRGVFSLFPGTLGDLLSGLISLVIAIALVFWDVVVTVAQLRAAIYENIGAGYRPDRVLELIRRDTNGFMRVCAINLVCFIVLGIFAFLSLLVLMEALIPVFITFMETDREVYVLRTLSQALLWVVPLGALFGYVGSFLANVDQMLTMNACGLWMRQFNVPGWGRSEDPLP